MGYSTGDTDFILLYGYTIRRLCFLEQRLLLFHLGNLLFQFPNPILQSLIFQPQHIKPIEKLFPLDLRPFEGALQPDQFKLSRSLIKRNCHRHPRTGFSLPAAL